MNKTGKMFVVFYYLYIALYLPVFFSNIEETPNWLVPFHLIGIVLSSIFMIIIIRDILKRDSLKPSGKAIWICSILFFWPVSVYYVAKYCFKPRKNEVVP